MLPLSTGNPVANIMVGKNGNSRRGSVGVVDGEQGACRTVGEAGGSNKAGNIRNADVSDRTTYGRRRQSQEEAGGREKAAQFKKVKKA